MNELDDTEISYEPMDVDLSSHSVCEMDISFTENKIQSSPIIVKKEQKEVTEKPLNIKPLTIHNIIENHKMMHNKNQRFILKLLFCLTIGFFAVIYQITNFKCNENLNIDMLRKNFTFKIYGQNIATEKLLKALESEEPIKIIALYGGTGVGKTYTVSIMLENLLQYTNIHHYTMPSFSQMSLDFMWGLIYCDSTIIVIDDLNRNEMNFGYQIKELVNKSIKYSKKMTILLLYNCDRISGEFSQRCDSKFLQDLKHSLKYINATKYFIKFESLTEEHLQKCIENELSNRILSKIDIAHIMKNFNVTIDGCKGVYQKIMYLSNI